MMLSKMYACTGWCWLLALPWLHAQSTNLPDPVVTPKWEFGLRGGAGFTSSHINSPMITRLQAGNEPFQYYIGRPYPYKEFYLGGFLTRNLSPRWSLRSELSLLSNPVNGPSLTLGLFPRYRLNKWLSLEAGLEAGHALTRYGQNDAKAWLGAVIGWKNVEFNLRYSPNYVRSTPFSQGGWSNTFQVGMSFNLSKVSKRLNK